MGEHTAAFALLGLALAIGAVHVFGIDVPLLQRTTYEPFHLEAPPGQPNADVDEMCKVYEKRCTCYGRLLQATSYPPQYRCNGFKTCTPINRTDCPGDMS